MNWDDIADSLGNLNSHIGNLGVGVVTEAHCAAGIATYRQHGNLIPKFWTQGSHVRAVAEPATDIGMTLDVMRGVMMLGFMVDISHARFIGRTAEAWTKTHTEGQMLPAEGLASIAETDPEVRTAIIAQGFDLVTNATYLAMASFDLDENAQPIWRHASESGPTGQFDSFAAAVKDFVNAERMRHSLHEVEAFVDDCGWRLRVFDE